MGVLEVLKEGPPRRLGLCTGLRGEEVELRDAVQGHGGQSVAEQYGRGVALERMKEALNS